MSTSHRFGVRVGCPEPRGIGGFEIPAELRLTASMPVGDISGQFLDHKAILFVTKGAFINL
jgi:hypothetical protein